MSSKTKFMLQKKNTAHYYRAASPFGRRPNNQLHFLSEPTIVNTEPTEEMLTFSLAPGNNYCYRVAFVRQDRLQEAWVVADLQLTLLSPPAVICIEEETNTRLFCKGSEDPWDSVPQSKTSIYWVPHALLESITNYSRMPMLRARVSHCPTWAFSTRQYHVRFLITELIH